MECFLTIYRFSRSFLAIDGHHLGMNRIYRGEKPFAPIAFLPQNILDIVQAAPIALLSVSYDKSNLLGIEAQARHLHRQRILTALAHQLPALTAALPIFHHVVNDRLALRSGSGGQGGRLGRCNSSSEQTEQGNDQQYEFQIGFHGHNLTKNLFPVIRWIYAQILLHIAAEIGGRREAEHVGNLDERERFVPQQTRNVKDRITVDPVVGAVSADLLRHFRQVFRRDAQTIRIIGYFPVLPVRPILQHFQKTVHYGGVLRGDVALAVQSGMEIEEIENGRLHGIDERFPIKAVLRIGDARFQQLEVSAADDLLFRREVHYGIEKQRQRPFHAVVALWRRQFDKLRCGINDLASEVLRRVYLINHFPFADNRQIPGVQFEIPFVETVTARPAQAEQMRQVFHLGIHAYRAQPVGNDNIFFVFHAVTVWLPTVKIQKNLQSQSQRGQVFPVFNDISTVCRMIGIGCNGFILSPAAPSKPFVKWQKTYRCAHRYNPEKRRNSSRRREY